MLPTLSINPDDGVIRILGFDQAIAPGMSKEAASAGFATLYRADTDHRNGYEWLSFQRVSFASHACGFSLCFHDGRLEQVHLGIASPGTGLQESWPSRDASEREVALIRSELRRQLHRDFTSGHERFAWGTAWSVFDEKGYQASAGVHYAV